MKVGILALQGGYAAHQRTLERIGHECVLVRYATQLAALDGLVLPGGESTTMLKLLAREELADPIAAFVVGGKPVLATCAGLILAAKTVSDPEQASFGWLDIDVSRNAWGRQLDSFEAHSDESELPLVFIRAPRVTRVGSGVEVLARFDGEPIMVRQGRLVGATFHPELTSDERVHREAFHG